jgi:3-oxoacyl-[acyl-carrier protein] reductase
MVSKLAIVTGSSKGIGAAITKLFYETQEWVVIGLSRSPLNVSYDPANFIQILGDLNTKAPLNELLSKLPSLIAERGIKEICVVHNFGYTHNASVLETTDQDWELTYSSNVNVPFYFTRELSPLMPKGSSHIYIGSTLSTIAVANSASYITSKHALAGLMKAAAIDLAPHGIRCNLVCPGFTKTNMAEKVIKYSAGKNGISYEDSIESIAQQSPLKRLLEPTEIANFVYYLANNPSISGEIIHVNGGFGLPG